MANGPTGVPRRWLQFMAPVLAGLSALVFLPPAAAARAVASGTVASTSAGSKARQWPGVVGAAMAYAAPRTSVPLQAPRVLPRAGLVPNSAQVRASTSQYSVALYHCASALPVEHPGIGVGACGSMASYYGYFEGHAYPGAMAALGALRLPAPPCPHKSPVPLAAGVVATLYSGPLPKGNCEAAWHEAHWSFVLTGDLNGGTHGDATLPWRQVASEVVSYLRGRSLPGDHGYMESDIAGDGLHTATYWQRGRDVYGASTYHGTLPALALAVAMTPYPAP